MIKRARLVAVVALASVLVCPVWGQDPEALSAESVDTSGVEEIFQGEEAGLAGAYSYDPAGRRDPFRSLLIGRESTADEDGLAGLLIEEMDLHGIWRVHLEYKAQMQGPSSRVWLVEEGDQLLDGEVLDVTATEIVFRQQVNDPTRLKPFREVVKGLVPNTPS